jgi:DNA-binding response OmpR family regulator
MREAIEATGLSVDLHVVSDGEMAIKFIDANDAKTCSLILLDLNLPKKSGLQVLEYVRQSYRFAKTQVFIVSSSDSVKDRAEAACIGADAYFRKPSSYDGYIEIGEAIKMLLLEQPLNE